MAKYYKAYTLDITEGERHWLIETMNMLNALPNEYATRKVNGFNMGFDMSHILNKFKSNNKGTLCGTVGCIKGWMGTLAVADGQALSLGLPLMSKEDSLKPNKIAGWPHSPALEDLFFPHDDGRYIDFSKVTPKIAANAIHQFLRGVDAANISWGDAESEQSF